MEKGIVFMKRGICKEKKYCWCSRRHFEPIDTDTDLGICPFHAFPARRISSGSFYPEEYRYLPIPLIVVIIAYALRAWHHYQKELAAYWLEHQRNERTAERAHADKRNLRKDIWIFKNILRWGIKEDCFSWVVFVKGFLLWHTAK